MGAKIYKKAVGGAHAMVAIRKLEDIVAKYKEVTPTRAPFYEKGVSEPLKDWAERTSAAKTAWQEGIQNAITKDLFVKGVTEAGTPKWQERAKKKGPARWSEGVAIAADDYKKGFAPYHETIAALTLPPRARRGDPRNIERVKAIAMALYKKRLEVTKK